MLTSSPRRWSERQAIRAACASGRLVPASRAAHYRSIAAAGHDISTLDTLAAVPGAGQVAASAAQDDEDVEYCKLFGGDEDRARAIMDAFLESLSAGSCAPDVPRAAL